MKGPKPPRPAPRWNTASGWILAAHLAFFAAVAVAFTPQAKEVRELSGPVVRDAPCKSRGCDAAYIVNGVKLACSYVLLGPVFLCRQDHIEDGPAGRARYFEMPTVFSMIGLSSPSRVLLELSQGGKTVHDTDIATHRLHHYGQCAVLFIILAISFWRINQWNLRRAN